MSLHPDTIKRGMRCNWKGQPERLIYLRKFNGWHQFQKIGDSRPVWCEVLDADLHMLEETKDDDALQPCGHPKSLALQSAESGEPLYCEACDDKSGRRDAELRESELAAANVALRERIAELEAQRVPLTKAEITACCNESDTYKTGVWMRVHETTLERLVRAIERAHGIEGGETHNAEVTGLGRNRSNDER